MITAVYTMSSIVRINAGGRLFQTRLSTITRFPDTRFAQLFSGVQVASPSHAWNANTTATDETKSHAPDCAQEIFLDVNPDAFGHILDFMRTNVVQLPTHDASLRAQIVHYLGAWQLMRYAFPDHTPDSSSPTSSNALTRTTTIDDEEEDESAVIELPAVCTVQLCDHMQHDQGMKRHAITITYGCDGYQLRHLAQRIRRQLNTQLSSTYWQCYQTNERAVFFTTTKVANGAADIMTTALIQQVVEHTEQMGYHLVNSYVTLSPDVVHTSVRMLIHGMVFRRVRLPILEPDDAAHMTNDTRHNNENNDSHEVIETFENFKPRSVGPQKSMLEGAPSRPAPGDASTNFW